jgi:hypothetical protein
LAAATAEAEATPRGEWSGALAGEAAQMLTDILEPVLPF